MHSLSEIEMHAHTHANYTAVFCLLNLTMTICMCCKTHDERYFVIKVMVILFEEMYILYIA